MRARCTQVTPPKVLVTWFVANQAEISHSCPHSSMVLLNSQTLFSHMSLREMKSIWPREWAQARDGRKDRNTISSGQKTMEMFPLIPTGSESAAATNFPPKWTSICLKESHKCWNLLQNKPVLYYSAPWFPVFLPLNSLGSHFWASGFWEMHSFQFLKQTFSTGQTEWSLPTPLLEFPLLCWELVPSGSSQNRWFSVQREEWWGDQAHQTWNLLYSTDCLWNRYLGKSWAKLVFTRYFVCHIS